MALSATAGYSGRWAHLCEPNSRRFTSSVRSDFDLRQAAYPCPETDGFSQNCNTPYKQAEVGAGVARRRRQHGYTASLDSILLMNAMSPKEDPIALRQLKLANGK
jgi:hypothetical protein